MINFVMTLSKFTAEPRAAGSWFHSHFDNVMTQFIINKRTDALKTDVNLLIFPDSNIILWLFPDILENFPPWSFPDLWGPCDYFPSDFQYTKAKDAFQEISLGIVHFLKSLKILLNEGLKLNHDKDHNQLIPFLPKSYVWLKLGKGTTNSWRNGSAASGW